MATLLFVYAKASSPNPNVYRTLGDVVYNSVESIDKLRVTPEFSIYENDINKYVAEVNEAKKIGIAIESGNKSIDKEEYLSTLRKLFKKYNNYSKQVDGMFSKSIKNSDSELFLILVNSGLLDTKSNKEEILSYYHSHSSEIKVDGTIKTLLDEEVITKKEDDNKRVTYKEVKQSKIKRIRDNDKAKREALEKQLDVEVLEKKHNIRENQIKELSGN